MGIFFLGPPNPNPNSGNYRLLVGHTRVFGRPPASQITAPLFALIIADIVEGRDPLSWLLGWWPLPLLASELRAFVQAGVRCGQAV